MVEDGTVEVKTTANNGVSFKLKLKKAFSVSFNKEKFSGQDQIIFFQNFASMSAAGLSLLSTLEVLSEQSTNPKIRKALSSVMFDVQNGQRLASAMRKFPKLFSAYLVENIHVGETTGQLTEILERIVLDLEKTNELRKKIISAIAYPVVVIIVMIFVVIGLVTYVLPKIIDLYHELGAQLPLTTRWLVGFYTFLRHYPYIVPALILILIGGLTLVKRNKNGLYRLHYLILKMPVFGQLIKEYNLAKFFRTTDTLFKSGMSLLQSVEVAKKSLANKVFVRALDSVYPVLVNGGNLSSGLKPYPFLFPLQCLRMLEVGERTGKYQEAFR
ncbi:MAG: type II secretion system F family protein, partial [Bacteroidota bacterium]